MLLLSSSLIAEEESSLTGQWKGVLSLPGQELPLIFVIEDPPGGKATGYLLSPAQRTRQAE
ncbi:MAG: hypothetical protein P1U85_09390 [Verrucomicrobiales bacterium]|nr:hypothetical protein [Verrucomicrobiales bacterium]